MKVGKDRTIIRAANTIQEEVHLVNVYTPVSCNENEQ